MKHEFVKEPLDADIAAMQQRWQDSGIPDLYEGGDPSASRERARNVRSVFYPWPKLPKGRIERLTIPGPAGEEDFPVPVALGAQQHVVVGHGVDTDEDSRLVAPQIGHAEENLILPHGLLSARGGGDR